MNDIPGKIAGVVAVLLGLVFFWADYIIVTALGAIGEFVALKIGMTGMAVLGVKIIVWGLCLGFIVMVAVVGGILIGIGFDLLNLGKLW